MRFGIVFENIMELSWLKRIFPDVEFHTWSPNLAKESMHAYREFGALPIIVRINKSSIEFVKLTQFYTKQKVPFEVIHLSDEYGTDDLSWYDMEYLTKVYRNYICPREINEFHAVSIHKIQIFPLGPLMFYDKQKPLPTIGERPLLWSFAGRIENTFRKILIEPYMKFHPYDIYFFKEFMDKSKKTGDEYAQSLLCSKFIPILPGSNIETFRLYEALEFGAIPIYTRTDKNTQVDDDIYFAFLQKILPELKDIKSPDEILGMSDVDMESYRISLTKSWQNVKKAPFVPLVDLIS